MKQILVMAIACLAYFMQLNAQDHRSAMLAKANEINLGSIHGESASPRPTGAKAGGMFWRFERGWIYWSPNTGYHAIYGDIMAKWGSVGYEGSSLGFPASDELLSDKPGWERMSKFENGVIYWRTGNVTEVVLNSPKAINPATTGIPAAPPIARVNNSNGYTFNRGGVSMTIRNPRKGIYSPLNKGATEGGGLVTIQDVKSRKATQTTTENGYTCTIEYRNLTLETMNQDMISKAGNDLFYPGAVFSLTDVQSKGQFQEVQFPKNPLRLFISSNVVEKPALEVQDPSKTNLLNARASLLTTKAVSIYNPSITYSSYQRIYDRKDFDLKVAFGASGSGWSFDNAFGVQTNAVGNKFLFDFTSQVFTISAQPLEGYKMFKDNSLNQKSDLIYVDKLSYGVKILVSFTDEDLYAEIDNKTKANVDALVSGGNINIHVNSKEKYKSTNFKVFAWGIPGYNTNEVISCTGIDGVHKEVGKLIAKLKEATEHPATWGLPLSYSLRFVEDDAVAIASAKLEELPFRTCRANLNKYHVDFTQFIPIRDAELYGWVLAQCFDGDGNEVNSNDNLLLNCSEGAAMVSPRRDLIKSIVFDVPGNKDEGYIKLWFWLNDRDNGPDDDDYLRIEGGQTGGLDKGPNFRGNFYYKIIPFSEIKPKGPSPDLEQIVKFTESGGSMSNLGFRFYTTN